MSKVKVTKEGVTQEIKKRFLHNFIAQGWKVEGDKKVSKIGKAKATADVIEEETTPQEDEDNWTFDARDFVQDDASMPNDKQGEE